MYGSCARRKGGCLFRSEHLHFSPSHIVVLRTHEVTVMPKRKATTAAPAAPYRNIASIDVGSLCRAVPATMSHTY